MSDKQDQLTEIEFENGKKVCMRALQIKDLNTASQAAAKRSGDSQFVFTMNLQQEMLKLLIVSVDGKPLTGVDKEQLDKFLDTNEYMELAKQVQELMGNAPVKARNFVSSSGSK